MAAAPEIGPSDISRIKDRQQFSRDLFVVRPRRTIMLTSFVDCTPIVEISVTVVEIVASGEFAKIASHFSVKALWYSGSADRNGIKRRFEYIQ